jgi:hypothetical protein
MTITLEEDLDGVAGFEVQVQQYEDLTEAGIPNPWGIDSETLLGVLFGAMVVFGYSNEIQLDPAEGGAGLTANEEGILLQLYDELGYLDLVLMGDLN